LTARIDDFLLSVFRKFILHFSHKGWKEIVFKHLADDLFPEEIPKITTVM
jgi:hypothetical protein